MICERLWFCINLCLSQSPEPCCSNFRCILTKDLLCLWHLFYFNLVQMFLQYCSEKILAYCTEFSRNFLKILKCLKIFVPLWLDCRVFVSFQAAKCKFQTLIVNSKYKDIINAYTKDIAELWELCNMHSMTECINYYLLLAVHRTLFIMNNPVFKEWHIPIMKEWFKIKVKSRNNTWIWKHATNCNA